MRKNVCLTENSGLQGLCAGMGCKAEVQLAIGTDVQTYVQGLMATHQHLTQAGRGIPGLRHARTPSHDSPSTRTNISNIVLSSPLTVNPNQIPHCADNVNKFLLP